MPTSPGGPQGGEEVKIHEQITPVTWCKHKSHDPKNPEILDALSWLTKAYPKDIYESWRKLVKAIGVTGYGLSDSLTAWNDDPKRTFQEVQEAFKKADL